MGQPRRSLERPQQVVVEDQGVDAAGQPDGVVEGAFQVCGPQRLLIERRAGGEDPVRPPVEDEVDGLGAQ